MLRSFLFRQLCRSYRACQRWKSENSKYYDVIVVGGGHAGCEAAHASSRVGCSTLLLTHKISTIGEMSCNPSFGGIGKGHLIKEIDALDGVCGRVCDMSGIHYRVLNKSKGPAVWGPRAQIDRDMYKENMQQEMREAKNLTLMEASVDDLVIIEPELKEGYVSPEVKKKCAGVVLGTGEEIRSSCVVLTAGTFLRGQINIGLQRTPAGRRDDAPSVGLAETIEKLGFEMGRLKTGTPPRIFSDTIDYSQLRTWEPDPFPHPFSFMNDKVWIPPERQIFCYTTETTDQLKSIILDTLHLNSHVSEEINGPRYCPSIESKIIKFGDKTHLLWVEPEGLDPQVIYLQGFSCTMPEEHQQKAVRTVRGLEKAKIASFGYGVEYDYMDPKQVTPALETKKVQGLFFAGQINGTTGYEEAAAQGVMAGINAARKAQNKEYFYLGRSDGYIGVLIDDLTTCGTNEPYRMFTSRSEFRMSLRPDNADERLTLKAYKEAGCVSENRRKRTQERLDTLEDIIKFLRSKQKLKKVWKEQLPHSELNVTSPQPANAFELLSGSFKIELKDMCKLFPKDLEPIVNDLLLQERLQTLSRYEKLLQKQEKEIKELKKEESLVIPDCIDYTKLSLKLELCEKLEKTRPINIAAASRIQGMTPTALLYLLQHIKRRMVI